MNIQLNLKTISIIIGITLGSITLLTSTYNGVAWIVRTADMLVYLHEYTTGNSNKILELDKRVVILEEKQ